VGEDYNKIKLRVKTVEEAVQILTKMALRADERMDGFDSSFSNLTVKLAALADAQIRTEEALGRLVESQVILAETQAHTDKRLDALIDIVREDRERRNGK
jgi:hypothetical protein